MYSVVLLMALGTGADTPAFGGRGCDGCTSSCASACSSSHGCRGGLFGGHGCNGGGHGCRSGGGLLSGLFHKSCNSCSSACKGCSGCSAAACCGGSGHACHGAAACGAPACGAPGKPKDMPKPKDGGKEVAASATIIVTLPADAKLSVDDNPTTSTSTTRVLVSPPLEPGREYNYTLKGEISRDGHTVTKTEQITVRAGEEARISIEFPTASVAQR